jgi:signal transduction histidine kinase/CheY-like chemotaxis protein/purine-cytosine permease-like protein
MAARQRIVRVRREYNQWVANQTLEDYALRFTAKSARRWSSSRVANTALGAISFLALEAIGGTITLGYGFANAAPAIFAVGLLIFATGLPISYYAAKYGVDIDLLTRGAGFGYIGSTITSLIYASFTFIFFAIEAVIMSTALETCFGVPLPIGYVLSSLVVIPLVTHGITFISRFQLWTQPIWVVLHVLPFLFIAWNDSASFAAWTRFAGGGDHGDGSFDLVLFGAAGSVVLSLIAQIGEQVDFLRFLPAPTAANRVSWWAALLAAGPGWVVLGTLKLLAGSFLCYLALAHGVPLDRAAQPTAMYAVAFQHMIASPTAALMLAGVFVVLSQLKINVTNSYAGSIAWSNFFSRLTHRHPGRVVWLVFNVTIALLLIESGVYAALEQILGLYSAVAAAWVGALVSDLVVNKPLKLSPPFIEFKRAHLFDINPVGVGAMLGAVLAATLAYAGLFGPTARAFTPFIALVTAFALAPLIAWATGGRYYLARKPRRSWASAGPIRCAVCENVFEAEDMAYCPAYAGAICSLCCSLDARCHDGCKPAARLSRQASGLLASLLPPRLVAHVDSRLSRYLGVLALLASMIGITLTIVYLQTIPGAVVSAEMIRGAFWKLFFVLFIIAGIGAWLFVLARESRRIAQDESRRQTTLLLREIRAHQRTDAQLQRAKEAAEAANLAKSRYVIGISHELRTPLNAILGYAQLLERDESIPRHRRDSIRIIRRSGDHLSGLIEGLLDISKIEAGRLRLNLDEVRLADFLEQIVGMFRLQASAKGIGFTFEPPEHLPEVVHTDQKRLRQILLNLLSNAIKFTDRGRVVLRLRFRSEVAEIEVEDTGIGIAEADLKRVFEPFERIDPADGMAKPGVGLGLTITKLLVEIMGGAIAVTSAPGKGSVFRVKLMLAAVTRPDLVAAVEARIYGYLGRRRTLLIADDDAVHRDLLREILAPLGFILFEAPDGRSCLAIAEQCKPDLVLLDISMPGMDGWAVARALRQSGETRPAIAMVSANAGDVDRAMHELHDAFLPKPIGVEHLLAILARLLDIEWICDPPPAAEAPAPSFHANEIPPPRHLDELRRLGRIGYIRGIQAKLDEIAGEASERRPFVEHMRALIADVDLARYMAALEALDEADA